MNLLHIGHSADRVDLCVVRALHAAGHALQVVADPGSMTDKACRDAGIPVHALAFRSRLDFAAGRRLAEIMASTRFDIVHAYTSRGLAAALRILPRRGGPRLVAYRGTMGHLSRWDPAAWMTYLHRRVDRIVCVSEAVRGYLLDMRLPAEKLVTIHKGHDPAWYAGAPGGVREEFGIAPDAVLAGFVGNVRPVKGGIVLLRAIGRLPAESRARLLLVGEIRDPAVARLAETFGIRERVTLTGFRSDAPRLSGACDFVIMPSVEREGLPKSVIEAMAQGIPPIVSRVGGMPELVEDGVCGLVIPPRDDAALAEAVLRLERDSELRRRLGRAAAERVQGPFHVRHTIAKTLALYEDLLRDNG